MEFPSLLLSLFLFGTKQEMPGSFNTIFIKKLLVGGTMCKVKPSGKGFT
jgi:hypothetical protein